MTLPVVCIFLALAVSVIVCAIEAVRYLFTDIFRDKDDADD